MQTLPILPMPNGASTADWLGTAMTAARVAAGEISAVREGHVQSVRLSLATSEGLLLDALNEVRAVAAELDRFAERQT